MTESTFDMLERLATSAELWGQEFATAAGAGIAPGAATIEDGDFPGTVARWLTSLSDHTDPVTAAELVSQILSWLSAAAEAAQAAEREDKATAAGAVRRAEALHANWVIYVSGLRAEAEAAAP